MVRNGVSEHEIAVYDALEGGGWATSAEVAERSGVAPRTARAHLLKLVHRGIVEQVELFPAHRYRLVKKQNRAYLDRLERARDAFGLENG